MKQGWRDKRSLTGTINERRLYIFDLDGTLVDAYQAIIASMDHTLHTLGYPAVDRTSIVRAVGSGNDGLLRSFIRDPDIPRARAIYRDHHYRSLPEMIKLLPGAEKLLKILQKRGKLMAVATNRPREGAKIILRHTGLESFFQMALSYEDVSAPKPDPEILLTILASLRVPAHEALYVGDMTIDALTGRAAGIPTVIVVTGSSTSEEVTAIQPSLVLRSLTEWPR